MLRPITMLIKNGLVITMDDQHRVLQPGWILVEQETVIGVGPGEPPEGHVSPSTQVLDAEGMLVGPGFVNSHSHLCQSFMRNLAWDLDYVAWLGAMEQVRTQMTPRDVYLSTLTALVENVRCGVTSIVNHHKASHSPEHVQAAIAAAHQSGVRMRLMKGVGDVGRMDGESLQTSTMEIRRLDEMCCNMAGKVSIGIGPTAVFRCTRMALQTFADLARELGLPLHVHVAEDMEEIALSMERHSTRPLEALEAAGALGPNTQLVHCVHITDDEIAMIKAHGATIVHCPVSNMYLASGIAPIRRLLDQGILVGLGTDGTASTGKQDMFEGMKTAALLARMGSQGTPALSPLEIVQMATVSGARCIDDTDIGQIALGRKADLVLVDLRTTSCTPVGDPYAALVYSCSMANVQTVIIGGEIVLHEGKLMMLDEKELCKQSSAAVTDLLKRAELSQAAQWKNEHAYQEIFHS